MYLYNTNSLKEICERDNCQIDFIIYNKLENENKLTGQTIIIFVCNCGEVHEKTFEYLNRYKALCIKCTNNNRIINLKSTIEKRHKYKEELIQASDYKTVQNPFENKRIVLPNIEKILLDNLKQNGLGKKICIGCGQEKSIDEYSKNKKKPDGHSNSCKNCDIQTSAMYRQTLKGNFVKLLTTAKKNAKNREEKGRVNAGECTIILEDIEELWDKQDGKCYYSKIQMNYDKNDWKISLERLNDDLGYIKDNIVLCCLEFNGKSKWSLDKIKEMKSILDKNITENYISFVNNSDSIKKDRISRQSTIINDIEHYHCNFCNKIKPINEFLKRLKTKCLDCQKKSSSDYRETPIGTLKKLISGSISSTNTRSSNKNSDKRDNTIDITFEMLIEIFNEQKGLCAYSNVPLQFGSYLNKNWVISLERVNPLKGYTRDNICLVCIEFNTVDHSASYKENDKGNSGWTKDKFNYFIKSIIENNIIQ